MNSLPPCPIIGVCGFKKSGKTTLIEKLLPLLGNLPLKAGFIKHDVHSFEMDHPGKDTEKIFRAGAAASAINDDMHGAVHFRAEDHGMYLPSFFSLLKSNDLIIVEGYKSRSWPKLWLSKDNNKSDCPREVDNVIAHLAEKPCKHSGLIPRTDINKIMEIVKECAEKQFKKRPVYGGILVGGKSRRMGRPKTMLKLNKRTIVENLYDLVSTVLHKTFFLGTAPLPRSLLYVESLPDFPHLNGPLAGILSAHLFYPAVDWLIVAVDMPSVSKEFLENLINRRRIGYGASVYYDRARKAFEPLCAIYSAELLDKFTRLNHDNESSLQELLKRFSIKGFSDLNEKQVFKNWNTIEDLGKTA
jgi:molybdopterin-guanine dinucleotide biosynthesis protein MobB